jgi:putative membrane protein
MGILLKILFTAVAAYIAAKLLPGVHISDVKTTLIVALVLALLNAFLKPILVALTIPITIITLNILIIFIADRIVPGFSVDGWLSALLFSLIVSVIAYILDSIF